MKTRCAFFQICLLLAGFTSFGLCQQQRQKIHAIYIPLADHYAAIVAYEKYRDEMKHADLKIERMKNWSLLRAFFLSGEPDLAFVMSPLAMDMFYESPNFRWVSLMHRDGNAMAINDLIKDKLTLPANREDRKPTKELANLLGQISRQQGRPIEVGVPHLQATHSVVMYKYLKDHGRTLAVGRGSSEDVVIVGVSPAKAPVYLRKKNNRGEPAAFEQSLPWADVVETQKFGHVAWYSKDVISWPNGHVECIGLAQDKTIADKRAALKEVIYYIHRAGMDIEKARIEGGAAMKGIAEMVRKHIPEHNEEAIVQSLRVDLNVINYRHLNIDKDGLKLIMDLAVEGGIIKHPIDIEAFSNSDFATDIAH